MHQEKESEIKNRKSNSFFTKEMHQIIKRINLISKSDINNIYIYPLIGQLRRYILSCKIKRPALKERFHHLRRNKENFEAKEDGTYDIDSQKKISFNSGYQVSFETKSDSYSNEEYEEIAYKMALMSDNRVYLGVYDSTSEISFHFNDLELAKALSIVFNQYSIWDWSKNDEIRNSYYKEKSKILL